LRRRHAGLTAPRLFIETPRGGGRVFETGDERLLQLAHQTESAFLTTLVVHLRHDEFIFTESAPVVVVFTKYDLLIKTKRVRLERRKLSGKEDLNKRSKEEARKVLDECVRSLEGAMVRLEIPVPRYVNVSSMTSHFPPD
jgi:hypothetical protein